ncbi:MAG: bifunctional 3-demethylubiquinol 3-O-methyltransferase/2-polyprenyl-6-hydroxyphenol methylase, partial [Pseudomonadota bacterium]
LVRPGELEAPLLEAGMQIVETKGVFYNPVSDTWNLSNDVDVNYMMLAKRPA